MFERIAEIEARYQELEDGLGRPELARDPAKLRELSQELAALRELVETYRDWKRVSASVAENEELANDGDVEIRELAKAELPELRAPPRGARSRAEEAPPAARPARPEERRDRDPARHRRRRGVALRERPVPHVHALRPGHGGGGVEIMTLTETEAGGAREVIASISGQGVYGRLKYESGVHRVQRVPVTESQGRIHTSTATVAVLPEADVADIEIDEKDLRIDRFRAGGPGGQSVNTTDSAIRVTHIPTGLVVQCQDEKSQHKNKAKAIKVLRARLLDLEQSRLDSERAAERKGQIGTGDRSERIRTYNFPQNRVTDHRAQVTLHQLDRVMEGELDELIEAVATTLEAEKLQEAQA